MEYTGEEIAQILTETITESAKDIMNLEDRRPLIALAAKTMFAILESLSGADGESQGRDLHVVICRDAVLERLEEGRVGE